MLPSLITCIWFEQRLSAKVHAQTNTQINALFPHTHTHTHLSGERHFVMCPYEHQHSHTYVKTCLSETLAGCCCPRQNGGFSLVVSTWSHSVQSIKRLCVLLQNDWPLKMPRWGYSQSVFWTFSGFFWTFWWTTFTVVRKFPRNRTRNVRASMNT